MLPPDMDADDLPQDEVNLTTGASGGTKDAMKRKDEDFFSSLGMERKKKEVTERPNPDNVCIFYLPRVPSLIPR